MMLSLAELPTLVTLAAVLAARNSVSRAAGRSAIAVRLRTLYTLIAALLFLRLLDSWLDSALLTVAIMVIAAWLPLTGLWLVEELLRRHAPRWLKLAVLGGGICFSAVAVSVGLVWSFAALTALAGFQALATLAMIGMLVAPDHALAAAERRTANTFLLALLLTIPLAISDFQIVVPDLPVRGGAFAALIMVLGTSRLVGSGGSPLGLVSDIVVSLAGAALGLIAVLLSGSPDPTTLWAAATAGFLIAALALLVERFAGLRLASESLVSALAHTQPEEGVDGLLRSHPLLASARIIDHGLLADYPADAIRALTRFRVIGEDMGDLEARDAARDLLDATAATHLLRLSIDPPRFLAISAGGLSGGSIDDELTVAAILIERYA
jgi:hypothetical protein